MWYDILIMPCDVERCFWHLFVFRRYASVTTYSQLLHNVVRRKWKNVFASIKYINGIFYCNEFVGLDNFVVEKFLRKTTHWIHTMRMSRWSYYSSLWSTPSDICASVLDGFREFGNVILQFVYQRARNTAGELSSFSEQSSVSQNWNFAYHTYAMHMYMRAEHKYLARKVMCHVLCDLEELCVPRINCSTIYLANAMCPIK